MTRLSLSTKSTLYLLRDAGKELCKSHFPYTPFHFFAGFPPPLITGRTMADRRREFICFLFPAASPQPYMSPSSHSHGHTSFTPFRLTLRTIHNSFPSEISAPVSQHPLLRVWGPSSAVSSPSFWVLTTQISFFASPHPNSHPKGGSCFLELLSFCVCPKRPPSAFPVLQPFKSILYIKVSVKTACMVSVFWWTVVDAIGRSNLHLFWASSCQRAPCGSLFIQQTFVYTIIPM